VLAAQECANAMLSFETCEVAMQSDAPVREMYAAANVTVNYICRDHVDGNYCYS